MQKALRGILIIILGIFGFGLFKHDFNFSEYIEFLSTKGASNFSENFNISDPNTRGSFLYSNNIEPEIDTLDAKLAELNRIAELGVTTGNAKSVSSGEQKKNTDLNENLFGTGMLSGENNTLSGLGSSATSGNINIGGDKITTTGEKISNSDGKSTETFSKDFFDKSFDKNSTGNTKNISGINNTKDDDFSGFEDFFDEGEGEIKNGKTQKPKKNTNTSGENNSSTKGEKTSKSDGKNTKTFSKDFFENETTIPSNITTGNQQDKTGSNLSGQKKGGLTPLLQKRLKQYQEFKKTLN